MSRPHRSGRRGRVRQRLDVGQPVRMPPAAECRAVRRFDARHPHAAWAGTADGRGRRAHLRVLDRAAHLDEIAVPDDQPGLPRLNDPRHRCWHWWCPVSGEHQRPRGQDRGRRRADRHQPAPPVRGHPPAHIRLGRRWLGRPPALTGRGQQVVDRAVRDHPVTARRVRSRSRASADVDFAVPTAQSMTAAVSADEVETVDGQPLPVGQLPHRTADVHPGVPLRGGVAVHKFGGRSATPPGGLAGLIGGDRQQPRRRSAVGRVVLVAFEPGAGQRLLDHVRRLPSTCGLTGASAAESSSRSARTESLIACALLPS